MNLELWFQSSWVIQLHVYAALLAVVLGAILLLARKGTARHKMTGKIWVAAMAIVALSSFAIHEIKLVGPFSPIHILSIIVLLSLYGAVKDARNGNIDRHKKTLMSLYFFGLVVPGLFTLMPGRLLNQVAIVPLMGNMSQQSIVNPILLAFGVFAVTTILGYAIGRYRGTQKPR